MKKNEYGFGIVGIIAIIIAVGVIGLVGWKAWDTFSKNQTPTANINQNSSSNTDSSSTVVKAPVINKVSDLTTSETVLDNTNIEGTELTDLNNEIDF